MGGGVSKFLVVGLGDSITAGNPGWDPDPARRPFEDPGDDERSQYLYWAARANPGMRFSNHGVGGQRTEVDIVQRKRNDTNGRGEHELPERKVGGAEHVGHVRGVQRTLGARALALGDVREAVVPGRLPGARRLVGEVTRRLDGETVGEHLLLQLAE